MQKQYSLWSFPSFQSHHSLSLTLDPEQVAYLGGWEWWQNCFPVTHWTISPTSSPANLWQQMHDHKCIIRIITSAFRKRAVSILHWECIRLCSKCLCRPDWGPHQGRLSFPFWDQRFHIEANEDKGLLSWKRQRKVKMLVAQLYWTLCNHMDYSPPGFSVHGILRARILEWVAIPFSRKLPDPGIKSLQCRQILYHLSNKKKRQTCTYIWIFAYSSWVSSSNVHPSQVNIAVLLSNCNNGTNITL